MKSYIARITKQTVLPENEPIFSEMATHIEIEDEAFGEFLVISQDSGSTRVKPNSVSITPEEWPTVRDTIEKMMATLRKEAP